MKTGDRASFPGIRGPPPSRRPRPGLEDGRGLPRRPPAELLGGVPDAGQGRPLSLDPGPGRRLEGSSGRPFRMAGSHTDITERKETETRLAAQNELLERAMKAERETNAALKRAQALMVQNEKLAGLGQMVAGVAHEINNPLAFVTNNVAVLSATSARLRELAPAVRGGRDDLIARERPELAGGSRDFRDRVDMRLHPGEPPRPARAVARGPEADPADRRATSASSPGSTRARSTRPTSTPGSSRRPTIIREPRRRSSRSRSRLDLAPAAAGDLLRGEDQPGGHEPAHQRHRRLPAGGRR